MSEFMLIRGEATRMLSPDTTNDDPQSIVLRLQACLRDLDQLGAGVAGAYLDMAIHHLQCQFDLDGNISGMD